MTKDKKILKNKEDKQDKSDVIVYDKILGTIIRVKR